MIKVSELTKKYGNHTAVDHLSFTIKPGHIYGFLGPNGAGKSTTMNMITGCLAPTSGEITVDGTIGYLPEIPPVYPEMTPKEYLTFVAKLKDIQDTEIESAVNAALKATNIEKVQDRLIGNLSKGYRQRVGISQAVLGNPDIIILDEPTVGLDPRQMKEIRQLIKDLKKNHTVILSTHILSEVVAVCSDIIMISEGKLVAYDTTEHIMSQAKEGSVLDLEALFIKLTEGQNAKNKDHLR